MYKLYKKIVIVSNKENKGYIVDIDDKSMMKNAIKWAGKDYRLNEFDNEGFEIELYDAAKWSSQGGKLSFMNCKVRKNNGEWIVGLSSDLLLSTLKSSTCINGVFKEKMRFGRLSGALTVFHEGMKSYKSALEHMEYRDLYKKCKKTKKRIPGYRYFCLTEDKVFLGDIYSYSLVNIYSGKSFIKEGSVLGYKNMPDKYAVYVKTKNIPANINKLSDLFIHLAKEYAKGNFCYLEYEIRSKLEWKGGDVVYNQESPSIRAQGDRIIENDLDVYEFDICLENLRKAKNDYLIAKYSPRQELLGRNPIGNPIEMGTTLAFSRSDLPIDFYPEQKRFFEFMNFQMKLYDFINPNADDIKLVE